jgi:hypothetical protein
LIGDGMESEEDERKVEGNVGRLRELQESLEEA